MAKIVSMGVYDIISKDSVPTTEIVSCIKHQHYFSDAAMYYISGYAPDIEEEPDPEPEPQKKGFIAGGSTLFGGGKASTSAQQTAPEDDLSVNAPHMDIALLRKTMKEETLREAQRDS